VANDLEIAMSTRPETASGRCATPASRTDPQSPQRRQALKTFGKAVGALAVGSAALSTSACVGPLVDPDALTEIPLDDVPQGRKMVMHADRRVELRRDGDAVTARLMICTHEFCDLTWYEAENNYRCTCHEGKFAPDGRPESGPVSKPMFELPTHIEGDTLIIGPAGELTLTG
jgi:Rieske Fe-S protein